MTVTRDTVAGWLKQRYGEAEHAVPSWAILQQEVPFSEQDRLGDYFNFPVFLTRSHGVTFNGSTPGTAFTLNDAVTAVSKNAQVRGSEIVVREKLAYGVLTAARNQGEAAFGNIMSEYVLGLKEAHSFYAEALMLYGQSATGIGVVGTTPDQSGTTQTITITAATWAPGLWTQMENAFIDIYATGFGTKRNATTTIQVTGVDPDTRTITILGTEVEMDTIVATDVVVFRGALSATTPTYETMVGTSSIIANSGTLFNISASTYNLWRAGSYTLASERLTFAHVMAGLAKAIVRGLTEDVLVLMSPFSWIDIMDDLSALKQFKEDTKSDMSMGTQGITFYGPMNGKVTLKSHPMMKAGQAQAYPTSVLKRVGSSDATMKIPNATGQNDNMFVELADSAGSQIRIYSDFGIISKKPARMVGFSGIVNNSLAA